MVTILWDLRELPVSKLNLVAMVTKIKMAASLSLSGKVDFPSIFDADSEEEADSDEEYRRHIKEDTGPSLLPLQVCSILMELLICMYVYCRNSACLTSLRAARIV